MSQQRQISIAAEVTGTSNGDLDQELEQRELDEKSAQLVTLENEIGALKASVTPVLGVTFMRRVEENPVWAAVDSQEFDVQFLNHEVPAVANIATLVKRAHMLKEECKELTQRLEQLRESQRHNKYSPVELFRLIEDLRKEVVSQRTEIVTLREETAVIRTQMERMRKEVEERMGSEEDASNVTAAAFRFDILSSLTATFAAPGLTTVTAGEAASVTVAYSSPYFADNYAISSIPLHRSRPSQWQMEVINPGWMVLGVIGNLQPPSSSWNDVTSFGWCSNGFVVAGYGQRALDSWDGWKAGDRGVFTYSPSKANLSLRLLRGEGVREFSIHNCSLPDGAFIHLHFYCNGTTVRFSRAV